MADIVLHRFLGRISSEICLEGVSLQRIALQRFSKAFVGDSSFHFGRENFFRDSLFEFFLHFFLGWENVSRETFW